MRYSEPSDILYAGILLASLVMFILWCTAIVLHLGRAIEIPILRKNPNHFGALSQKYYTKIAYTPVVYHGTVANTQEMDEAILHAYGMMPGRWLYTDRAYLSGMIVHHEAALDMASEVLKKGGDPQVKKWAEKILYTQKNEIEQMRTWLTAMGGENVRATAVMSRAMHNMMAPPERGNPDRNFISMMIEHHAVAVEMASQAVVHSHNFQVVRLSKGIIDAQTKEIDVYEKWLKGKSQ